MLYYGTRLLKGAPNRKFTIHCTITTNFLIVYDRFIFFVSTGLQHFLTSLRADPIPQGGAAIQCRGSATFAGLCVNDSVSSPLGFVMFCDFCSHGPSHPPQRGKQRDGGLLPPGVVGLKPSGRGGEGSGGEGGGQRPPPGHIFRSFSHPEV